MISSDYINVSAERLAQLPRIIFVSKVSSPIVQDRPYATSDALIELSMWPPLFVFATSYVPAYQVLRPIEKHCDLAPFQHCAAIVISGRSPQFDAPVRGAPDREEAGQG